MTACNVIDFAAARTRVCPAAQRPARPLYRKGQAVTVERANGELCGGWIADSSLEISGDRSYLVLLYSGALMLANERYIRDAAYFN